MTFRSIRSTLTVCASVLALTACGTEDTSKVDDFQPDAPANSTISDMSVEQKDAVTRIQNAVKTAKSTQGSGHPSMWTLADEDTTVYLFGTVHLLPEDLNWKTESFTDAFQSADKLYLEIDSSNMEDQQKMQALVVEHGMFKDGGTLSSTLNEDDLAAVSVAAEKVGVPMASLDPAKPWFAGLQLGLVQLMKSGYSPDSGVEQVLVLQAKQDGKSFGHFESALDQIQILSGASLEDQIDGLVFTSKTIDMGKDMLDTIVAEWADGDVAGMSALMGEPAMFGTDEAYDALMVQRNKNWIPQIEATLEEPGVKFVAVGAGHLAGPDSVITMLRAKGHEVNIAK